MFERQTCANSDRYMEKGLTQLREAGQAAYKAAQAKNQDQVLDAAEKITTACSTCHDPYREKTPRCSQ
jgi:cytochrome c556